MSHPQPRIDSGPHSFGGRLVDVAMRVVPAAALVAVAAFFAAQQAVSPHHRAIKGFVVLGLMALMFRFDMVYSVYLFALLFAFPSGISIGSSNSVLMTIIPMIWAVRATSARVPFLRRTPLDLAIGAYLLAYVVALFNVTEPSILAKSMMVLWRQFAACMYFFCICMFVNTEDRLFRLGKIVSATCALVMLTAVVELFFPGRQLIPGWIGLDSELGLGRLGYRIEGLRAGGSFVSTDMVSDFGTHMLLFMVYFTMLARNPVEKTLWLVSSAMTFIAILATANRGGTSGMIIAFVLALYFFRRRLGGARIAALVAASATLLIVADTVLSEHTIAVSVLERFRNTEFEGIVPENRTMTWLPTLEKALERPYFGHGPYFDTGVGLAHKYWPHNGYLFAFYTLGLFGLLAFLWVLWRVARESNAWRLPGVRGTRLGNFMALAQIWLVVMLWEQLRTDHQRDDIYPYIVWMCFGIIVTGAAIARRQRSVAAGTSSPPVTRPAVALPRGAP